MCATAPPTPNCKDHSTTSTALNTTLTATTTASKQGRHYPTLAGMARMETPVIFGHLISFLAIFSRFLPLCHRILPIVSPVFEIFETPGMAIAIPAILVSPPLVTTRSLFLQCQQQGAQSTQWMISVRFCLLCFHVYKNSLIDQIN